MKTNSATNSTARFVFLIYNALLLLLHPLLFVYTLWRRFGQKKSAASFAGQWGKVPAQTVADLRENGRTPIIWLHAVSVGETMAARPIARALKQVLPQCRIALSCTTDTGFQTAQAALQNNEVDATFYFPLDVPLAITRALDAIRPDVFLTVETELWPNFLHLARARGVLCLLVNGRVSDKLLDSAPRTGWLWRWMISNLDALLMRSEYDVARMREICDKIGAPQSKAKVLAPGDVKLDGASASSEREVLRAKWREILKIKPNEVLWVCGSTHPAKEEGQSSEEEIVLRVYQALAEKYALRLLIAPRHIERTEAVIATCEKLNARPVRRSEIKNTDSGAGVLVLDTVGELAEIYAAADVAFVGGSLIPRGGHNVLEPVLRGVPVLFGPHMANFREAAALVENAKLGAKVEDENALRREVEFWLEHDAERASIPERAEAALAPHQGAAGRIAQEVAERLKL